MEKAFRNLEELTARAVAIEKGVNTLSKCFAIACKVAEQMNGKVLNKRLATKIQQTIEEELGDKVAHAGLTYEYGNQCKLSFFLYTRSYNYGPADGNGYRACSYFDGELYTDLYFPTTEKVDADAIRKSAESRNLWNARKVYEYNDAVKCWSKDRSAYTALLLNFQKAVGALNPLLVDSEVRTTDSAVGREWEDVREAYLRDVYPQHGNITR